MFCRVVMWPLRSGTYFSITSANDSSCSGLIAAERQLHPDHLRVGLALAVDPLLEAELDELVLGLLAPQESRGLGVEVVELALEDRDEVPRDVFVDLGVLERADLALALLRLGEVLVELGRVGGRLRLIASGRTSVPCRGSITES